MDKILSARVDEIVIRRIGSLARRLRTSKKAVIERAITELSSRVEAGESDSEIVESFGAWCREESPDDTRDQVRGAFQDSMERHHR